MGKCKWFFLITTISILLIAFLINNDCVGDYFLPNLPELSTTDQWGDRKMNETTINGIIIKVPDATINAMIDKIKTRIKAPLFPNSKFKYGFNADYLNGIMDYWTDKYQWRLWESEINKYSHYFTTIKGLQIHFIHVKPVVQDNQKVIPILLLHGWPGSFFEFYKVIPLLTTSKKEDPFVFEIICPSLVGYGWSDAPMKPGFGLVEISDVFFQLMDRLNISKFYVQGGDFGSLIASSMSKINPVKITGIHINFPEVPLYDLRYLLKVWFGSLLPAKINFLGEEELQMVYPWKSKIENLTDQMGYFWIQATRPSTIGIALSDSPAGLAAYILEKFGSWSNNLTYHLNSPNGGLENIGISVDEMLTNVMIYYITNSISSSMRFYKEFLAESSTQLTKMPVRVPVGIALFPNEIMRIPRKLAKIKYKDIRQFTHMPRGGHFAALEEPELLVNDIRSFVKLMESA